MKDIQNESLSALMDGEVDELALHRVLKDMEKDTEMRAQWARFHVAQDIMKGGDAEYAHIDLSKGVMDAIAAEQPIAQIPQKKPWLKSLAGLSVAASVTVAVVLGARFNPLTQDQGSNQQLATKPVVEIVTPGDDPFRGPAMVAQSANGEVDERQLQEAQERLNSYLKQHAQDSALGQGRTAMPFARVVNFEKAAPQVKGE